MSRGQHPPRPAPHDYTPEIALLRHQLATLTQRWHAVAPTPPSLAEAVEELSTAVEELHTMNEELTEAQWASLESQRRYQELFEWVPEAYLITDLQGLIQEANRAAARLFHLDRPQLLGLPLAVCIAWEERRAFRTQLAWLQNGAEVREWVIRVQPRHRPAVPVACHVTPARDIQGRLTGLRWLLRDLTAEQQAQETFEQRVRELTTALQAMRDQAELRGRELHHCMKKHLQIVSSLLDWQAADLPAPRTRAIFKACQGRIRAIALIHELLHRPGGLERIELGHYLRRLAVQVFQAYGVDRERVHLTLQADPVTVDVNTATPCGLLVHEVLSNCVQHAFPASQTGDIMITLRAETAGQVTLTIRDTGMGLPADVDVRQAESFGLHLIRGLTEQLRGTLVFTRDGGTRVTLRFPC